MTQEAILFERAMLHLEHITTQDLSRSGMLAELVRMNVRQQVQVELLSKVLVKMCYSVAWCESVSRTEMMELVKRVEDCFGKGAPNVVLMTRGDGPSEMP